MIDVMSLVGIVFSGLSALVIEDVGDEDGSVVVRARTESVPVACPGCGTQSARVHGYFERTAADVPVDGRRVVVRLRARRMRCPVLGCGVQTFREQVAEVLERYQRRTVRLAGQVEAAVRALAGRAGSRLLAAFGHLGQAYAWTLGMLPYARPEEVELGLVDFDRVVEGNAATQLLALPSDAGQRKARVVAAALERRGFGTHSSSAPTTSTSTRTRMPIRPDASQTSHSRDSMT